MFDNTCEGSLRANVFKKIVDIMDKDLGTSDADTFISKMHILATLVAMELVAGSDGDSTKCAEGVEIFSTLLSEVVYDVCVELQANTSRSKN